MLALVMATLLTRIPSEVHLLIRSIRRHAIHDCPSFLSSSLMFSYSAMALPVSVNASSAVSRWIVRIADHAVNHRHDVP